MRLPLLALTLKPGSSDKRNDFDSDDRFSLAKGPALRQKLKKGFKCTLQQYSVFSGTRMLRPSTIRRT